MINFRTLLRCVVFLHLAFIAKAIFRKLLRRLINTNKFLRRQTAIDVALFVAVLVLAQIVNCGGPDSFLEGEFLNWRVWLGCQPFEHTLIFGGLTIMMAIIEIDTLKPTPATKARAANQAQEKAKPKSPNVRRRQLNKN